MPIFAEGSSGWASFTSNSGGYLVGFLVGGMFSGCVSGKFENRFWASLSAMFFGTFLILLFGVLILSLSLGLSKAFVYGFIPFIVVGVIMILLWVMFVWWLKECMLLSEEICIY